MSKKEGWIDKRLSEAKKTQTLVTDGVEKRVKSLLTGKIGEQQLTPKELAETAKVLIAEMNSMVPPEAEASHED